MIDSSLLKEFNLNTEVNSFVFTKKNSTEKKLKRVDFIITNTTENKIECLLSQEGTLYDKILLRLKPGKNTISLSSITDISSFTILLKTGKASDIKIA